MAIFLMAPELAFVSITPAIVTLVLVLMLALVLMPVLMPILLLMLDTGGWFSSA
jgi:hypothetical protein